MSNKKQKQFKMTPEQKALFDDLTTLQQQIALNSLSGMSNIDSYRNSKGKAKTDLAMEASCSQILNNLKVVKFLDTMKEVAVNNAIMSREEMMERLTSLSRTSMSDLVDWSVHSVTDAKGETAKQSVWAVKDSAMQDPVSMASIAELSAGKDGFKIKQHSPLTAMKQLADLAGYNEAQKIEHSGSTKVTTIDLTASPEDAARMYTEMMEGK